MIWWRLFLEISLPKLQCVSGTNYWRNRVLKVASDYKRKAYFAVCSKDEFSQVIGFLLK